MLADCKKGSALAVREFKNINEAESWSEESSWPEGVRREALRPTSRHHRISSASQHLFSLFHTRTHKAA